VNLSCDRLPPPTLARGAVLLPLSDKTHQAFAQFRSSIAIQTGSRAYLSILLISFRLMPDQDGLCSAKSPTVTPPVLGRIGDSHSLAKAGAIIAS